MGLCNFKSLQRKQKRLPPVRKTVAVKYLIEFPRIDHVFTPFRKHNIPALGAKVQQIISII